MWLVIESSGQDETFLWGKAYKCHANIGAHGCCTHKMINFTIMQQKRSGDKASVLYGRRCIICVCVCVCACVCVCMGVGGGLFIRDKHFHLKREVVWGLAWTCNL